jgi:archaellum component FlaF (FlaF/FlaG flagellin family)
MAVLLVTGSLGLGAAVGSVAADEHRTVERTIDDATLAPGESTTVTVEVMGDSAANVTLVEEFDPAFASVEIVDDDGADFSAVRNANDELFATWGDRESATLTYEVTIADDAASGTHDLTGYGEFDNDERTTTTGDDAITVEGQDAGQDDGEPDVDAARTIDDATLAPGESTTVTVEIDSNQSTNFTVVESFDPAFGSVEIVDNDSATLSGVRDAEDELFATYVDRESATLTYEVTVADDAAAGATHDVSGFVDVNGTQTDTTGDAQVTVADAAEPSAATRTFSDLPLEPGETATVTVDITHDEPTNFTLVEGFDPAFASVEIVDNDSATFSGVRDANDELFATYVDRESATLTYEVTAAADATPQTTYGFDGFTDVNGTQTATTGDSEIQVQVDQVDANVSAVRTIDDATLAPGESTTVTVEVTGDAPTNVTVIEQFDPAFGSVEIVDNDSADFSGVRDAEDELFATYTDREEATLTYEVTVADDAAAGETYAFDGFTDVNETQTATTGDDEISVETEEAGAVRTIDDATLAPGESTTVTVEIDNSEAANVTLIEQFDPAFASVDIVDNDSADFSGVRDAENELFATWGDREEATLTYEVTVAEDASAGETYSFSGFIDVDGTQTETTGDDEISVETEEAGAVRTIDDATLAPGESTTVTVEVDRSEAANVTAVEQFDPAFASVEIVDNDSADFSGVRDAEDELFATWGDREEATLTYEVTIAEDAEAGTTYAFDGYTDVDGTQTATTGDSEIEVQAEQVDNVSAVRTLGDATLAPGESTTVTVEVTSNASTNFTAVEQFDPAFGTVEIVDDDSADFSGVRDAEDELFATWSDRESATLVYEVTLADDAAAGTTYSLSGFVDANGTQTATTGDDSLQVEAAIEEAATRTLGDEALEPGESTVVTVEVDRNESANFTVLEQFDPAFASVEILNDDGADFSGVRDAEDELFATYTDRAEVTLVYRVTVPEDTQNGTIYEFAGFTDVNGTQVSTAGDDSLSIGPAPGAERTLYAESLNAGESAVVTVEVDRNRPTNFTVVEQFDPAFETVELLYDDGADYSGIRDANDELFATYSDRAEATLVYQVTVAEDTPNGTVHQFAGFTDANGSQVPTVGDDELSVRSDELEDGEQESVRTIDDATLAPGESTVVTVEVNSTQAANFTIVESLDPAFGSVEIVDDDGADFSGVRDANDQLFATYGDRENVTLTYRVTAAADSENVTHDVTGFVDVSGEQVSTEGDDEITVEGQPMVERELVRTVENATLAPGESTTVTVDIDTSQSENFTVVESFDPAFASVEIVDDDGADYSAVRNANDELFATYGDRENVTLTYEVTVAADAEGVTHDLTGFGDFGQEDVRVTVEGDDAVTVEGAAAGAVRTIDDATLAPGESTTVTVDVTRDEAENVTVIEQFDPAFGTVEIVDNDSADFSGVRDAEDELFATWGDRESATLTYEVTVADDAEAGTTYDFDGFVDVDGTQTATTGDSEISVASDQAATRTIDDATLVPGESTTVTVEVDREEAANVTVIEQFDPAFGTVEIVDNDSADFSEVREANDELFATWGDRESATLTYEVTIADDAAVGATYAFDGFTDVDGTQIATTGDDEITVEGAAERDLVRSIDDTTLAPGESTTVTVEVDNSEAANVTVIEQFDPAFGTVEIVDDDGADFSEVREANDELFATWGDREEATLTYEVTVADDAEAGATYNLTGYGEYNGSQVPVEGDSQITVGAADDNWETDRTISEQRIDPGESATVTVTVTGSEADNITVIEQFDPAFGTVEIVDDDGADFSEVRDANDELFATWGDRENVTLTYRVTAAEDIESDTTYSLTGFVEVGDDDEQIPVGGDTDLVVEAADDGDDDNDGGASDFSADVTVEDGRITVDIEDAGANRRYDIDLGDSMNSNGVTITGYELFFQRGVTGSTFEFSWSGSAPDGTELSGSIAYLSVDSGEVSDDMLNEVEFRFSVSQSTLDEQGMDPEDVQLYRYEDGEWVAYETTHEGGNQFVADGVPGFSTFAIGPADASAMTDTDTATPEPDTATPEPDTATPEPETDTPGPDTATPEPETDTPEPDTATPEPETAQPTTSTQFDGFSAVVALIAVLLATLVAARASRR